jgi:hypothetical protein
MEDSAPPVEVDWLETVLILLKNAEVAAFRAGDIEIVFTAELAAPQVGFVARKDQAGTKASEAEASGPTQPTYHKAFGGLPPSFAKRPKDE